MSSSVVITYNGTDITDHVMFADTRFSTSAAAQPGRAQIRCKDPNQELSFVTGKEVTLTVDSQLLWGGYVMSVDYVHAFPADDTTNPSTYQNRMFVLNCVDYNILFDKRIIHNDADPFNAILYNGNPTDGTVIKSILDDYCDITGFDLTTEIDDIVNVPDEFPVEQGQKLRKFFEDRALQTAGVFYVSPDKKFHWHEIEDTVYRWGFSDVPIKNDIFENPNEYQTDCTYPFREVTCTEDGTMLVTDAMVWGGSPIGSGGTIVYSRQQDEVDGGTDDVEVGNVVPNSAIDRRGRWQIGETYFNGEPGYGIQEGVTGRAKAIIDGSPGATQEGQLKGYKNSQWQFHFRWFADDVPMLSGSRNHIRVGYLVYIEMQSFFGPSDPKLLPCRQLDISFETNDATGASIVVFDADFALNLEDPVKVWDFIRRKRRSIITTSTQTVAGDDTTVYGAYHQCTPTPDPNGVETAFYTQFGYILGQLNVYINGLLQRPGIDFTSTNPTTGEFTMTSAPHDDDTMYCTYRTLAS
jgi:hypothetical protein